MPTKRKTYPGARFSRETLRELVRLADESYWADRAAYEAAHPAATEGKFRTLPFNNGPTMEVPWSELATYGLSVTDSSGSTDYGAGELEEFFDKLGDPVDSYSFGYSKLAGMMPIDCISLSVNVSSRETRVSVGHPDSRVVDRFMAVARDSAATDAIPVPEPEREHPRVFIGHGGSGEWQKTERWLRTLGIEVKAYETLPHSGRTIERVLTDALSWANFALLVMTAEDEQADETMQARQNVVHELGLFQGRLGWDQAIVLLEAGTSEFSNIAGTNQFRFPAGSIDAKHGDIIVALRERFPGSL